MTDWQIAIMKWLHENNIEKTTASILWNKCLGLPSKEYDSYKGREICSFLREKGWKRCTVNVEGKIVSGLRKTKKTSSLSDFKLK